jgi:hypothetical protein
MCQAEEFLQSPSANRDDHVAPDHRGDLTWMSFAKPNEGESNTFEDHDTLIPITLLLMVPGYMRPLVFGRLLCRSFANE